MGYMFRSLKTDDPYFPAWLEMRRRKRLSILTFLLWMPATIVLTIPFALFLDSSPFVFVPAVVGMGVVLWAHWRAVMWPCPHCHKPFYFSWFSYALLRDDCAHCGLPKYAPCDPKEQAWEVIHVKSA